MSIFKKHICSECSNKTSFIAKQFSNGKILCKNCASILFAFGLPSNPDYEYYKSIKEYQDENYLNYYQKFRQSHTYQNIHMDLSKGLFYIGDNIDKNTIFLSFKNVTSCDIGYSVPAGTTSILGTSACNVSICINTKYPNISYRYTLRDRAKSTYEDSEYYVDWLGDDFYIESYSYSWPSALLSFVKTFYQALKNSEEYYDIESGEFYDSSFSYERGRNKEDSVEYMLQSQMDEFFSHWGEPTDKELEEESKQEFYESAPCYVSNESELSEQEYSEIMELLQNEDEQSHLN